MPGPRALACACALAWPVLAVAVPPDARLVLAPGAERFLKPGFSPADVVANPPGLVRAELLPSGEILVEPLAGARGPVAIFAIGSEAAFVWDACVSDDPARDCPRETSVDAARAACPSLGTVVEDGKSIVTATITSERCLDALRASLAHATVSPFALRFVLEEQPAQVLYRRVLGALKADPVTSGMRAGFLGATLHLSGSLTREGVSRAVVVAWREVPGRLSFETAARIAPRKAVR